MLHDSEASIRASYDSVATEYARHVSGELSQKPLDRQLLDRFAAKVRGKGQVCDMGCGPGHVARYLRDAGLPVFGLDLSPGMLERARELNPDISFREDNMFSLNVQADSLAGITCFYGIVHFREDALRGVFQEMLRVLQPQGMLLLGFHCGNQVVHRDEMWGAPVSLDFHFFPRSAVVTRLEEAGFTVQEAVEREPYGPEVEYQSRRGYVFARRP